jgi:hypothetical protein
MSATAGGAAVSTAGRYVGTTWELSDMGGQPAREGFRRAKSFSGPARGCRKVRAHRNRLRAVTLGNMSDILRIRPSCLTGKFWAAGRILVRGRKNARERRFSYIRQKTY